MLPSCGWSQFSLIVGTGPMFSRSMLVASTSCRCHLASFVITVPTSVWPIAPSIFSCGHFTTVVKGNMYSFLAMAGSCDSQWMTVGRR